MADVTEDVRRRLRGAGLAVSDEALDQVTTYLELLRRWNRRMNLTAFDLDVLGGGAIDRLIVEPMLGARAVASNERRVLDIGSGGGSPAVPLTIAAPWIDMTMVEVRAKKAAFLREVARSLPLALHVETTRVEALAEDQSKGGTFDLVTFRAVRPDRQLWRAIDGLLAPGGRVLWFGGVGQTIESDDFAPVESMEPVQIVGRR